jgi:class 3 adenylate cyclase
VRGDSDRARLALLVAGVGIFALAFGLYVREELRGGPWRTHVLVVGAEGPGAYPRVERIFPGVDPGRSRLEPGDRLLRAGAADLRGAPAWTVYASIYAAADARGAVEIEALRNGVPVRSSEALLAQRHALRDALLGLAFAVTALTLLRRAPDASQARWFAAAALVWATAQFQFQGAAPAQTYAYFALRSLLGCLWAPLMILAAVHFPEGVWPRARRLPRWPWLFAALGPTWTSIWMGAPLPTGSAIPANGAIGSLAIAMILVVVTRNYRLAGPAGRRQVRWVLLGCYVGLAPSLIGTLAGSLRPEFFSLWFASQLALAAIPLSIWIAIRRSNFLDVDRLISRAGSLTLLLGALGAAVFSGLPWLARQASTRAGVDASVVQVALGVALAFAVVRLEPLLRPRIERLFFRERQAFQDGIGGLVAEIHESPDPGALSALLGDRLDRLLHPDFCVIYGRGTDVFAPVFSRRCAITPHFALDASLVTQLAARVAAVDLERDRGLLERLSAPDQAALRGLGASVLVPVIRERDLVAFVALGAKASGDVYTATDLALLGMVGGGVSTSLLRFDDEQLLREARALQEKLRQYVPASIAEQIAGGSDLEAGERVISVLFADLRGYTRLAEGRVAEEIFRIVSRYTEVVTSVVTQHGGTVVEFNGDGMMAVFGAPKPLPDKERRALAAARGIVAAVSSLATPALGASRLEVGVGLATGSAYVGAIRSVDRRIWSAIGNTTNLAARLQALTRELGTPIVIDEATRDAAGDEARDFERHPETAIRGLRLQRDVFALAIPRAAVA